MRDLRRLMWRAREPVLKPDVCPHAFRVRCPDCDQRFDVDLLLKALRSCAVHEVNPDTCGVCGRHFPECDSDIAQDDFPIPTKTWPSCAGARARAVLASHRNVAPEVSPARP